MKISLLLFSLFLFYPYFSLNHEIYKEFNTPEEAVKYSSKELKNYLNIPQSHIFLSPSEDNSGLWNVIIYQQQCIEKTGGKLKMNISNDDACLEFQMVLNMIIPSRKIDDKFIGITNVDLAQIRAALRFQFPQ